MDKLQRYTVLLYSWTSDDQSVTSAKLSLFCQMLTQKTYGNSWNYVFICYNLGDVAKYKF